MPNFFDAIFLAGSGLAATVTGASAQQAAPETGGQGGLAEIVVTAQKRQENLQDVPIAITAVTGDTLSSSGVTNTEGISAAVPGITLTRQSGATMIYIRGIGTTGGQAGQDGAVSTFVDGVYQPSMAGSTFAFNNIERIEVLKGPQGTLYGRNATGGAVNVITRDPSFRPTVAVDLSYGNRNAIETSGYASLGLTDTIAVDFAGIYSNLMDGFGTNRVTGKKVNTRRDWGVRSKLLFEPGETTRIVISGDYLENNGSFGVSYAPVPGTTQLISGPAPDSGNRYDITSDVDPFIETRNWGVSGRIEQDIGSLRLTSISAYRRVDQLQYFDLDAQPLPLATARLQESNKQFTQELQLASDGNAKLKWIVGLFYLDSKSGYEPFDLRGAAFAFDPALAALGVNGQFIDAQQKTKSYAIFGQATMPLTERLNLTLGARYTVDERDLDYDFNLTLAAGGLLPVASGSRSVTYKEPTWRAALDYKIGDDSMLYASYSRGFKSGAFNLTAPLDPPVPPERLDAYEIGLKSELFDRTLRLNLSGFYYKYDNIQLTVIRGGAQTLINAASAEVKGVEAELELAPAAGLTLRGGLQYTDGEYTDFPLTPVTSLNPVFPFGIVTTPTATQGNRLIRTPKFAGNLALDYSVPVAEGDEFGFHVTYQYSGGYPFEPDGRLRQPDYHLVNGSLSYTFSENATIRLWARNLFNERYFVNITGTFLGDIRNAALGRQYGMGLSFRF